MQDKERMAYKWLEGGYKEEQVGVQDYKNILFLVCVQSVVKVFFLTSFGTGCLSDFLE